MVMWEDETFKKIMRFLAKNPKASLYKIDRATGVYRVKVARKIEQYKLTGKAELLKMEKGKRNAKNYSFTFGGVISYLMLVIEPKEWKNIDKIAESYPDMLLTFKKWHLFKETGLHHQMAHHLKLALKSTKLFLQMAILAPRPTRIGDKKLRLMLDGEVLFIPLLLQGKEREALMCLYRNDKELSKFINRIFGLYEKNYEPFQNAKTSWMIHLSKQTEA